MNNKVLVGGLVLVLAVIGGIIFLTTRGNTTDQPVTTETTNQIQLTPTPTESPMEEATGNAAMKKEGAVKEFTITGSPFKFVPNKLTVKKGDSVKITFKDSVGTHNLVIEGLNVKTKVLQPGGEETVQFVTDKAGTYKYYCSVDNHRGNGMEGTLVVE